MKYKDTETLIRDGKITYDTLCTTCDQRYGNHNVSGDNIVTCKHNSNFSVFCLVIEEGVYIKLGQLFTSRAQELQNKPKLLSYEQ